jgi:hypothetical protein
MSIRDAKLIFSSTQTVGATAAATQTFSTNIIDLGAENLDIGSGTPLYLNITIATPYTFIGATEWCSFKLQGSTGAAFAATDTFLLEKRMRIPEIQAASDSDGVILQVAIPNSHSRYLRLMYWRHNAETAWATEFNAWVSGATPLTKVGT